MCEVWLCVMACVAGFVCRGSAFARAWDESVLSAQLLGDGRPREARPVRPAAPLAPGGSAAAAEPDMDIRDAAARAPVWDAGGVTAKRWYRRRGAAHQPAPEALERVEEDVMTVQAALTQVFATKAGPRAEGS